MGYYVYTRASGLACEQLTARPCSSTSKDPCMAQRSADSQPRPVRRDVPAPWEYLGSRSRKSEKTRFTWEGGGGQGEGEVPDT